MQVNKHNYSYLKTKHYHIVINIAGWDQTTLIMLSDPYLHCDLNLIKHSGDYKDYKHLQM